MPGAGAYQPLQGGGGAVGGGGGTLASVLATGNTTGGASLDGAASTIQLDNALDACLSATEVVTAINNLVGQVPLMAEVFN